jgi:hypothetical protein
VNQPTERDLSYRDRQRNGLATPSQLSRHMRRALNSIIRGRTSAGTKTNAAVRLLHVDPVTAREWLRDYVPQSAAKPRKIWALAGESGGVGNKAKATRRAQRAAGVRP